MTGFSVEQVIGKILKILFKEIGKLYSHFTIFSILILTLQSFAFDFDPSTKFAVVITNLVNTFTVR